ncbi:cytochrome c oxidase subunit CcoP [Sulfuriferula multivorans]|uniref:Cbb3-type cytochrome c oxidase subunit n=1 Tax=Sulfuriferula multivorans TaxID=1559896 RepID=A0A401JAY8_9PROT|nr:cytochrome-c oxidase, cbb3-type subunit III [Sulfuriferula multivorans]GBL44720.1 cytochrome c oxidase subunit CcoP [Sulfuriferula multivorans]
MSDFVSSFWSLYIAGITVISIVWVAWFLKTQTTRRLAAGEKAELIEKAWDGDLQELNNPLPRWWLWLFYLTIVFGVAYLALYPGLGSYKGMLDWSATGQWQQEQARANAQYGPIFDKYLKQDLKVVAADPQAREMGQRLFLTYCSQCHGSDAAGARGFPNLTDHDWLYGGDPETIQASIANGRAGVMPALGAALGVQGTKQVANYVLSLSGSKHDATLAAAGRDKFATYCAACHQANGKGTQAMGAPNLTDKVWLYGGSEATIIETITKGRNGHMPAQLDKLGAAKVHLLAAYVYGLSQGK